MRAAETVRLTTIGHATVLIELDGARVLTDPLLRDRTGPLRTGPRREDPAWLEELDAVLLSHFHRDHYDPRSLAALDPATLVVGPPGAARRLRARGFREVVDLRPGESVAVRDLQIRATPANHGRLPAPLRSAAVGFVVSGSVRVYFAGDTDLFPEMADLAADRLHVALLPIGGWGPRLGKGHLDPRRAVRALELIRPRIAIPIHWGLLRPLGLGWLKPSYLTQPAELFARLASELVPDVDVRILEPGESLELEPDVPTA
jgi:L-ascorbate metabolism protein UlaG (beta-lactamase superfamily)